MSICVCCQRSACRRLTWVKAVEADGTTDERAAVVAFLRGKAGSNPSPVSLADAIERGEHRQ